MATSESVPPRLADHFPRIEKRCAKVANVFFDCFTEAAKMQNEDDIDAGKRGLEKCLKDMKAYDTCMIKEMAKKPLDVYRVQEEYRVRR